MSPFSNGKHWTFRRSWAAVAILLGIFALAPTAPAFAFSTGPHVEMTADAMAAEGFGPDAIGTMEVSNTFTDLYQWVGASPNPYSGQSGILPRLLVQNLSTEDWPTSLVAAATRSHFDNTPEASATGRMETLGTTAGITAEWDRLRRAVWTLMREARDENDPQKALEVLGMSLHQVQDFYAHTNWIEPTSGVGADGPGWQEHGFGSYPTWFDVPASKREQFMVYGDSTPGHSRRHGYWSSDGNISLATMMNKDSPPRPFYLQAAIAAYFATRQWVEAARSWVADDGFWRRMQRYRAEGIRGRELDDDREGLFGIMLYSGRWEGQGEPIGGPSLSGAAGDLLDLRASIKHYFEQLPKSSYRKGFERLIVRMADRTPSGSLGPVPSSQDLQKKMGVVVLRVKKMAGIGAFGLGDPWPDQADMYARMRIDGQQLQTDVIHGHNEFSFGNPYEPFTKYKVLSKDTVEQEPVESIQVEVSTADALWAGTDDDVFLRLGKDLKFPLDKRLYDDFERGDRDTYSVPIDDAVRDGMRVGDIRGVRIEKESDGAAGGWKLGGVRLRVNGDLFYENEGIDRWLEDDRRAWVAPDFVRRDPRGPKIPVWLQLREDDSYYGDDDEGDINPDDRRDTIGFGYALGQRVVRSTRGANNFGGRLGYGGDLASITFTLETIMPELMGQSEGTPVSSLGPLPDLTIKSFDSNHITIANQGEGHAGPFRLKLAHGTVQLPGLAAGSTVTRPHTLDCGSTYYATVDDLEQVAESDETNNSTIIQPGLC